MSEHDFSTVLELAALIPALEESDLLLHPGQMHLRFRTVTVSLASNLIPPTIGPITQARSLLVFIPVIAASEPIKVRHQEGRSRGFLVIRSQSGTLIGNGEMSQVGQGDRVTFHMTYRFIDGSVDDETAVYTQKGVFQLLTDRHIQRGPFFPKSLDLTVDDHGTVTSRYAEPDGTLKVESKPVESSREMCNGLYSTLFENLAPGTSTLRLSALAPTEKILVVHFDVSRDRPSTFTIAGVRRRASVFRLRTDLGGIVGVVAPLLGKQPDNIFIWVAAGEASAVVRATGQLSEGGIELAGATFPRGR